MKRLLALACLVLVTFLNTRAGEAVDKTTLLGTDSCGSAAALPGGASAGSISLWFARRDGAADQVLFVYGSQEAGRARGLWLMEEDKLCFYFWGWPDDLRVTVPGGITPNRWHHVAATYDGATARLYYDGRLIGSVQTKLDTGLDRHYLARNLRDDGRNFDGKLDEVQVHHRALSDDEIRRVFAEQSARRPEVRFPTPFDGVDLPEIIFTVRQTDMDGHWYANFGHDIVDRNRKYYHDGGRLCRLNPNTGEVNTLLHDPQGGVRDPQLHYDGRTILFSYRRGGQPYYHLYEIQSDGTGLRQLTDGPFDDFEPTYLPDGDIIFCSSRCNRWVPCYFTQVAVLYRCNADGQEIRQLSANTEQENTPWVLPDGRILYQRWEYVDRSQIGYHHLWTMNPDGSGQMVYFGNQHPNVVMIDAKPIPGTDTVVASFAPGHGRNEHEGVITIVDPDKGPDARDMARSISPSGFFRDPYPLAPNLFLVARDGAIELMDDRGHRKTIYEIPPEWRQGRMKVHEPRPLAPRPRERIIPPRIDGNQPTGRVVLQDIYQGRNMAGVERGEIKKLLVLEILPKPYNMFSGMEPLTYGGTFLLERVLGTVPVEPDGSAYVELPAMLPLFFVALDEHDLSVKRMQSFFTLQPGEQLSCVGCHEQRNRAPRPSGSPLALRRQPSEIEAIPHAPQVFDFPRDIQPILDRHCVECHDYDAAGDPTSAVTRGPMAGGIILSGDRGPVYSHSYYMLTISGQFSDGRNLRKSNYAPRALGSSASPLLKKLDGDHYGVKLADHEKALLRLWIDSGAAYPGTYAALGTGMLGHYAHRGMDRSDLRWPSTRAAQEVLRKRCAACHQASLALPTSPSDNKRLVPWAEGRMNDLALPESQRRNPVFRFSRHLLYNLSRPEKSLQLLAPLSQQAGGYAICKTKDARAAPVFESTEDPDYRTLLSAIHDAKQHLDEIKRFDMPDFQPRAEYVREMKRYGILPSDIGPDAPIDVYATDEAYWRSLWYRLSPKTDAAGQQGGETVSQAVNINE
jgi:hypothetical protein